ncbi:nuclear transport factor 2 family protein [Sorangium sp. So ce1014]|uniref:nuclear transport factor 2 family protein n=1 Tax=Sorangium sp. So ce1014 TaxID=3133326 RepID=UPI003F637D77
MATPRALSVVESYYDAFRAGESDAVALALAAVFHEEFVVESPMVHAKYGGPLRGQDAVKAATAFAPYLKHLTVEATYLSPDGHCVATLIRFPSPVGEVVQSEHFEIDPDTPKIKRLRSYYDPRKLLAPGP